MASPTYYHISNLLEKMSSVDKDFRFMATNDLMSELQKDSIKLDDETEKKVVKMVLKLLEDKNGEVQNLAVKCLGPLINKVKAYQIEFVVENLCNNMIAEKEELRDISSIALKTIINEFPLSCNDLISSISHKLITNLIKTITKQDDTSIQLEGLDMIGDIISRFGSHVTSQHNLIEEALMPQISNNRLAVRKRSIISLSYLTIICSQQLFTKIINFLVDQISQNKSPSLTRSYIQCLGVISRTSGTRLAPFLPKIVPLLINFCKLPGNVATNGHCSGTQQEEDDELKEYCLQAFESTIKRCTKEMSPYVPEIIDLCLDFIAYDPNYNYGDDEDASRMDADYSSTLGNPMSTSSSHPDNEENEEDAYGENGDEGEGIDEYSEDDEDLCWKVRRAGAKCLQAVVESRPDLLALFYARLSPALIARFKEREENVKLDLLQVYCTLLKQTQQSSFDGFKHGHLGVETGALDSMDVGESSPSTLQLLQSQVPPLVRSLRKLIKHKSPKIKQGCFVLLTKLSQTYPNSLTAHMPIIIAGVLHSLADDNAASNMKIETLTFLSSLLATHQATAFHPYLHLLVPTIIAAINDPFYKIVSEALSVTEQIVKIMRPLNAAGNPDSDFNYKPFVLPLYNATLNRLCVTDIDQEVKEKAISCMAYIINVFGDMLKEELKVCLPIFGDRLKNEITRLAAVKAIRFILASPFKLDLQPIAVDYVQSLSHFLRKNNRALRVNAVLTLRTLLANYPASVADDLINSSLIPELPQLISDNDLRMSDLVLQLLSTIAQTHPACIAEVWKNRGNKGDYETSLISELLVLMRSPLLQGEALYSLIKFFKNLVNVPIPGTDFKSLIEVLIAPVQQYELGLVPVPTGKKGSLPYGSNTSSLNPHNRPVQQAFNTPSGSGASNPSLTKMLPQSQTSPTNSHLHKQALSNIAKVVGAMASVQPPCPTDIGAHDPKQRGPVTEPNANQAYLAQRFFAEVRTYVATNNAATGASAPPSSTECVAGTIGSEALTAKTVFALLALGEMGRSCHVFATLIPSNATNCGAGSRDQLCWSLLSECFSAPAEDVKFAAAYAIGNIGAGNLKIFLPYILSEIGKHPRKQYLTLHALKEVINGQLGISGSHEQRRNSVEDHGEQHSSDAFAIQSSTSQIGKGGNGGRDISNGGSKNGDNNGSDNLLAPFMNDLWALLLAPGLLASNEEGTRTVTAECLGKLCLLDSGERIPDLAGRITQATSAPLAKCTVLSAIIYAISSQPDRHQPIIDQVLKANFGQFLTCLEDEDINVRRVALVALNSAAHNKPFLIRDVLGTVLPHLYNETKIRNELIREVEMGPFKHSVDDGLDIRKTAYECMYTLVDSPACFDKLDLSAFLNHVENGLKDHYDIKMLTYLMLARLATLNPTVVLSRFDRLIEPLKSVIVSKVKANSVKQEHEKQEDLKRCALRAIASLIFIPGADKNPHAIEFINFLRGNTELSTLYDSVQREFLHQQQQIQASVVPLISLNSSAF